MIKHIVCFTLNDKKDAVKAKEVLLSMKGKVPLLRDIEVGIDFLHSQRSAHVYLAVVLDNKDALDEYQKDAYHVEVVKKYMHSVIQSSVSVDFEIEK